jgi:hypothetical protein
LGPFPAEGVAPSCQEQGQDKALQDAEF